MLVKSRSNVNLVAINMINYPLQFKKFKCYILNHLPIFYFNYFTLSGIKILFYSFVFGL